MEKVIKQMSIGHTSVQKQRIAVLDLGTNTFHLLIADVYTDRTFKKVFKSKIVVKLGEGGIHQNYIADRPFKRGMRALVHYSEIIKKHKTEKVHAFATSAIRSSTNGSDFVKEVFKQTGIKVKVIPGEEEARLICLGVRECMRLGDNPVLIMDIGGGSTEFIIADKIKIHTRHSFNIGAARLLEMFQPSDPVKSGEMKKVEAFLESQLAPLDAAMKSLDIRQLVGSSGSFDTFAEMIGYRFYNRNVLKNANCYSFNIKEYHELHDQLLKSTIEQRKQMKGLIKMRVDMIVLASICTQLILKRYKLKEMALSKYALKEGALSELIQGLPLQKRMNGILRSTGNGLITK